MKDKRRHKYQAVTGYFLNACPTRDVVWCCGSCGGIRQIWGTSQEQAFLGRMVLESRRHWIEEEAQLDSEDTSPEARSVRAGKEEGVLGQGLHHFSSQAPTTITTHPSTPARSSVAADLILELGAIAASDPRTHLTERQEMATA